MRVSASSVKLIYVMSTYLLAAPAGAAESQTPIHWPTFLRGGPGYNYGAVAEVGSEEKVGVLNCANHWCAVSYHGALAYADQDALTLPELPSGRAPKTGSQDCFEASDIAWLRPIVQIFCEIKH